MGKNCGIVDEGVSSKRIGVVTLLNFIITVAEGIGGLISGSLSLLSDALHNLSDTLAIAMSWVALKVSSKPATRSKSYGYERVEILTAFINGTSLGVICIYLLYEGVYRFFNPSEIDGVLMLVVSVIGLLGNLFSILILKSDSHKSINLKSSYLHLLGDTLSSVGVVTGAVLIIWKQVYWVDPIITILVAIYIFKENIGIIKKSFNILMQASADLDYKALRRDIMEIDGVKGIHHLHTWQTNEKTTFFESHICTEDMLLSEVQSISEAIEKLLNSRYGIKHVTLQLESTEVYLDKEGRCFDLI